MYIIVIYIEKKDNWKSSDPKYEYDVARDKAISFLIILRPRTTSN